MSALNPTQSGKEWPAKYRVLIFVLLLLVLLSALARLFDKAAKKDFRSKARWVISQQNGKYDFAVLGSSRSYVGIDIATLEKKLGQNGINLSLEGTSYPEEYLAFKLFLDRNQIDHLILDLNIFAFDNSAFKVPFHAYDYLPDIGNKDVADSLRENFGYRAYFWEHVPFFKNAEFNSKLGFVQLYSWIKLQFDKRVAIPEFDENGSCLLDGRKSVDKSFKDEVIRNLPEKTWAWDKLPKKYFFEILRLAKARGIKTSLISMPEYHLWAARQQNRAEILSFYETVAQSNNLSFLRFDEDAICTDRALFINSSHLNREGAVRFSSALAKRLNVMEIDHAESVKPLP